MNVTPVTANMTVVLTVLTMCITDIDECEPRNPQHDCGINAYCEDRDGGFDCFCNDGYEGEPRNGCTGK